MSESTEHRSLVKLLMRTVNERYQGHPGLCLYWDDGEAPKGCRPRPLSGYVPDILAITVPSEVTIIGEAKTPGDIKTAHSEAQLRSYLRFLACSPRPQLIVAVHPLVSAYAYRLVRVLKHQEGASAVSTEILTYTASLRTP